MEKERNNAKKKANPKSGVFAVGGAAKAVVPIDCESMAEISWIRCLYKKLPTSAALATDA